MNLTTTIQTYVINDPAVQYREFLRLREDLSRKYCVAPYSADEIQLAIMDGLLRGRSFYDPFRDIGRSYDVLMLHDVDYVFRDKPCMWGEFRLLLKKMSLEFGTRVVIFSGSGVMVSGF